MHERRRTALSKVKDEWGSHFAIWDVNLSLVKWKDDE
jgi:hypothetical protein